MQDILQALPIDKWNLLENSLKHNWPAYAYYYNYVKNAINWKTQDPSIDIQFYCPYGRTDAGVFFSTSNVGRKILIVFSHVECKELLMKVLCHTNRINWSDCFNCASVHETIQDVFRQFLNEEARNKGLRNYSCIDCYCLFKSKEDCLKIDVKIPKECILKRLGENYATRIHSLWPYRDVKNPEKTLELIRKITRLNGGYGIFLKKDDSLVSWIMQCDRGCLSILVTPDEHRRKGYAKIVFQAQMRYLAEKKNFDMTSLIDQSNEASIKLLKSLGFKSVASPVWFSINPKLPKIVNKL